MKKFDDIGMTQRVMATLLNVNRSTTSRFIANRGFKPLIRTPKNSKYSIEDTRQILGEFTRKDFIVRKKIQSFYNFKGGTGKTSLCFQVSTHLALYGFKVLVVDADPQAHLSTVLGFEHGEQALTLYDVMIEGVGIREAIHPVFPGLFCIPSNLSLTRIAFPLDQMPKREEVLKRVFAPIRDEFDFIIFDTNPTISTLNRNIIVFSDTLNIVCETQPLSLHGLKILMEDLKKFCSLMQMDMPEIFVIPNKYEDRSGSAAEAMAVLRQYYADYIKPDFAVRKSEDINTASKRGLPVSLFAKVNSNSIEDIQDLVREIIHTASQEAELPLAV